MPPVSESVHLCRFLRWKSVTHGASEDPIDLLRSLHRQAVPFSCLLTCQSWGPDDEPASAGGCTDPSRECFEPTELPAALASEIARDPVGDG